tara:strand:- start:2847 stop:3410 length:564 start_codon:yes stop_codon:yes gene_type:complete
MTNKLFRFSFFLFFSILLLSSCTQKKPNSPQDAPTGNRKSPIAISSIKHENTYIKIVYGQPYRNGRTIFGEWEPYGEVWRAGANEATEITITEPVLMNMKVVDAGTYSLFTIPNEDSWTIILNNGLGQWGAFDYNEQLDAFRFEVSVKHLETPVEAFTIEFSDLHGSTTVMSLSWDVVKVEIPIRFY